jgi:hypothetical protein
VCIPRIHEVSYDLTRSMARDWRLRSWLCPEDEWRGVGPKGERRAGQP